MLGILALGLIFRIYRITSLPMYGDELTQVYDSYSILKTGMDATGEKLPVTFRMGAGRPGGYIYTSIPFVALFGPTEVGVRALSVLSGLGMIVLVFLLARKFFPENVALATGFLMAISPWDIYLSRGGFEAHFALLLATLGTVAFFYKRYIIWAVAWGLTIFTYPTFKLTLPLMFILLMWQAGVKKLIKNRTFVIGALILVVFGGLSAAETLKGRSEERFSRINIFSDTELKQNLLQKVNEERTISFLPESLKPFFYNRPIEYSLILVGGYIKNLSPEFLFLKGDGNPRHNPGEMGMFYLVEILTIFMGAFYLWKDKKKELVVLGIWILIVPLATMLISDPHGLRNAFMLVPFTILSAFGFSKFGKAFRILLIAVFALQFVYLFQRVYFLAPAKFGSFWSREAKEASFAAIKNKEMGIDTILLTKIDNIEYAYPVYAKIDPKVVAAQYGKFPKKYEGVVITDKYSGTPR